MAATRVLREASNQGISSVWLASAPADMAATTALREALNQGISSGNFVDTKIIVYSHRDSSGRICRPKALYANSCVLKTVPYFNDLLFGKFAESQSKDFDKETVDEEGSAEDYGYLSDSDLEDDEDEKVAPFRRKTKSKAHPFDPFAVPGGDNLKKIVCEEHEEHAGKGKVVKVPDMAFVTFQAFLMYLYTNDIDFAPFGSEENRRSRSAEIAIPSDDKVPRPSPKSIYRLADKYDIPVLKTLALNYVRSKSAECDIVEEAFSRFASRYGEMRGLYLDQLAHVWMEDSTTETTRANVNKKIDSFTEGDLDHATEFVSALWEIANKDGDVKAPANTSSATTQAASPEHWAYVKMALINSIRKGVFFDRKYWARHSKAGDVLKPVYFSSVIMGDKSQQLNKVVKYLKGQNVLTNDLEGDLNVESDCEGDPMEIGLETSEIKEEKEETRAVLITGSFSAWKSLFFYRCTDAILFAPLKSQGADSRLKYIREKTVAETPPPCSPKSIYVLARLLEIQPLYDSALVDIKSKVSLDNAVDEVFSWVTAGHENIMEMECDLLVSNFKDPKTIARVKENIGHISDGSLPHCADSLKLGLKKAFDLKKQKRQPPGVKLRCNNSSCQWYNNHPPYSSVGATVYCQMCRNNGWGNRYFQCVGCGCNRGSTNPACQNCGKRFI